MTRVVAIDWGRRRPILLRPIEKVPDDGSIQPTPIDRFLSHFVFMVRIIAEIDRNRSDDVRLYTAFLGRFPTTECG